MKINKQKIWISFVSILVAISVFLPNQLHAHSGAHSIEMTAQGFVPDTLDLDLGETVVFENIDTNSHWPASNIHPTHEIYSDFDPKKPIAPGESWSFIFSKSGTWKYHDHLYPERLGTIVVNPVAGSRNPERGQTSAGLFDLVILYAKNLFLKVQQLFSLGVKDTLSGGLKSPVETSFKKPAAVDYSTIYLKFDAKCPPANYDCTNNSLKSLTQIYGPALVLKLLGQLKDENRVSSAVDDHQLAHNIGRTTAQFFGINSQAFLLCDTNFNYGCQHGYFEYVLGKTTSPKEAALLICEAIDATYPEKFKFYCYHGVGHGVMMAKANDLTSSLAFCDELEGTSAQAGCWQGVFMENTNAGMRGEARTGVFSEADSMAPCNTVSEKYRHECFINHAGFLMHFFMNDIVQASQACLAAPANFVKVCMQSIGLMVSNPSWQSNLLAIDLAADSVVNADKLCQKFPENYQDQCMIGAVDNFMNFDQLDLSRVARFCQISKFQTDCYTQIGRNLHYQTNDVAQITRLCDSLGTGADACRQGAGL